ncbi:MAG: ABC transporter permease [Akkermansia sp.]|nr:ABC transporter permease [Akkermansia sp.]
MNLCLVLKLVWQQLRHEWLAAACLCIAMAAALVPVLMILGLKEGTVQTLRQRLAADPANLEIRMPISTHISSQEVESLRALPGVGFCIPATRILATSAHLVTDSGSEEVNLIPTGAGDPLLARHSLPVPRAGEIVLGSAIAEKLSPEVGGEIRLRRGRMEGGRAQYTEVPCRVVGILPDSSGVGAQVFVPLSLVIAVEEYAEGARQSLSAEGAQGLTPPAPVYHGMWLNKPGLKDSTPDYVWDRACPFSEQRPATEDEIRRGMASQEAILFFNSAQHKAVDKLRRAYQLAKQNRAEFRLWNPPVSATRQTSDKTETFTIHCIPEPLNLRAAAPALQIRCGNPADAGFHTLLLAGGKGSMRVEAVADTSLPPGEWTASASVLGVLHGICQRGLFWSEEAGGLTQPHRAFSRIRLYARGLDDVEPLVQHITARGYHAEGNIAGIRRVQELNAQLEILFTLLAVICVTGAAISLALNLFNGVLKRRRDYAILATLGFSRATLTCFPICESLLLTLLSIGLSFFLFHGMAHAISVLFAAEIETGENLCFLSPAHHALVLGCGIAIGLLAAVCAAVNVLRTQPSTAIREM